jgi:transposase
MAKHFKFTVDVGKFSFSRNQESIANEASLDGFYMLRTSVPKDRWPADKVVSSYKSLSEAEKAFRTLKDVDLKVRPIHHRLRRQGPVPYLSMYAGLLCGMTLKESMD